MNLFTRQHCPTYRAAWRGLGVAAVMMVMIAACNAAPQPNDRNDKALTDDLSNNAAEVTSVIDVSASSSAIADRSAYEPAEMTADGSWPDTQLFDVSDLSPFSLARGYLASQGEGGECLRWTQTRIERLDNDITAVAVTTVGLCDDSLGGVERRYDLALTDSGWVIDWVGTRYYCSRTSPPGWVDPGNLCP
ncbi:hypothetical protein IQ254_05280 [Nodosilinea sp. LEGE 07088]|uniref:hypothetical protein n=1 Tax=Nodosilinea sp. LEGE 07088 TaxID=2777968 RepID=UPI001880022E|nr:hypothetical protein [Nodosilinea sp. LEGE 07088]MBE9136618.1 hypothetical protein [Nodosilinea sp. LEGE 07088]